MRVKRADRERGALAQLHPDRAMRCPSEPAYGAAMGFLRHRGDEQVGERFLMREKLLAIGDDFWIENEQGERAYKVNGKAFRLRQTFVLENAAGDEVVRIQERKLTIRDKIAIERGGDTAATVHKALVGIRDRFAIDVEHGHDLKAHGNVLDHEYEIERDGDTVATVSKKWFRVRESYGVDVAAGEDTALILAITVAIDSLTSRD
jgi:uncharacterized protein YxjI